MTDAKTLAYINMYAVLGTLENLCELDPKASALVADIKPISIGFEVEVESVCSLSGGSGSPSSGLVSGSSLQAKRRAVVASMTLQATLVLVRKGRIRPYSHTFLNENDIIIQVYMIFMFYSDTNSE